MARRIAVFGGAGFIGSHVVDQFVAKGAAVTVVDGLLPETGGSARHLARVSDAIELRAIRIEEIADLVDLIACSDVVIDCMAWTRHVAALENPAYDLRLNLESHLTLIAAARHGRPPLIVYLGSRSQYGRPDATITEATPMVPQDVQAIHKAAADHHFRVASALYGLNVVSLRAPNCFGERQPVDGDDIGLIGGFVRTLLAGDPVTVYGTGRQRSIMYVRDLASLVIMLSDAAVRGFAALNVAGDRVDLADLAAKLAAIVGRGSIRGAEMPHAVGVIEAGDATVDESRLRALVGEVPRTDLCVALAATVDYFRERLA